MRIPGSASNPIADIARRAEWAIDDGVEWLVDKKIAVPLGVLLFAGSVITYESRLLLSAVLGGAGIFLIGESLLRNKNE